MTRSSELRESPRAHCRVVVVVSRPPFSLGVSEALGDSLGGRRVRRVLALYIIHPNRASPTNCEAEPSFTLLYVPPTHAGMLHVHDVTGTVPVHAPVNGSSLKCYLVHNESTEYAVSFTSLGRSVVAARLAARHSVRCPPSETREAEPPLRSPSPTPRQRCARAPPHPQAQGQGRGMGSGLSRVTRSHRRDGGSRGWARRQRGSLAYSRPGTAWWCDCECGHHAVIPTTDILNDLDSHLARLTLLVREQLDPATFEFFMSG